MKLSDRVLINGKPDKECEDTDVGVYSVVIVGNIEERRAEAEVSRDGQLVALVYEASDGWHTEVIATQLTLAQNDFNSAVDTARQTLSHYVNRRGANPPQNMSRGALSLWLMMKDDGTVMGISLQSDVRS